MARRDHFTQKDRDREAKEATFRHGVGVLLVGVLICGWFPWFGGFLIVSSISMVILTVVL